MYDIWLRISSDYLIYISYVITQLPWILTRVPRFARQWSGLLARYESLASEKGIFGFGLKVPPATVTKLRPGTTVPNRVHMYSQSSDFATFVIMLVDLLSSDAVRN